MPLEVVMQMENDKSLARKMLRDRLAAITQEQRHQKSQAACSLLLQSPEFQAAQVVMIFLSMPSEVDTAQLALAAWQQEKTVVVPKVSWHQRRILPLEISSLTSGLATTGPGIREPVSGKPVPVDFVDLVVVPGLGFTPTGHRLGRGMGFYDRFLAQKEFSGISCGLAFEEQVVESLPVLDHDVPLGMLVTDADIRRFAPSLIGS
jgi:5-formyltetrahydrofolate cyclo-ligase